MKAQESLFDEETGERKYLDPQERRAFFAATQLEEADAKYFCQMLYFTGCRLNEALQVTPRRLDYSSHQVRFRTLKQGRDKDEKPIIRNRNNELPEGYLNELQGVYSILKKQKGKKAAVKPLWGFTDRTGRNYVYRVMEKAGITGLKATPKGLRHSMGVSLALNKVPATTIQKVLGHRRIQSTFIYLNVVGDERRQLVSQVWQ